MQVCFFQIGKDGLNGLSGYSSNIEYPGVQRRDTDEDFSPTGWYAQWHLLSYNGKRALLKVGIC